MTIKFHYSIIAFSLVIAIGWSGGSAEWIVKKHRSYSLYYTKADEKNISDYNRFIVNGIASVQHFFDVTYKKSFNVYVHPNRTSLDSQWQKDWNMPGFKSECWMVASGVSDKLDMLSPGLWDKESCEHPYADKVKTQQLITHELVHVYHGQLNASPDFSDVTGIDWFVEGLATYASGQCDSLRMAEVKKAIEENNLPISLDKFWTGKLKYGLSGSMVLFMDHKYGRSKLKELLPFSKNIEILTALNTTEPALLHDWKIYIKSGNSIKLRL
jgi:hypothetical protein